MLFNQSLSLLSVTGESEGKTGVAVNLRGKPGSMAFRAFVSLTQEGGANTPTAKVIIETSPNGSQWAKLTDLATSAGTPSKTELLELPAVALKVRARTELAGNGVPSHTATVLLLADSPVK